MRKRCLLIIDVQTALTSQYPVDENKMIEHIRKLIRVCHNQHLEIVYVRHHDEELILNSDGWQIDSRITPRQDDKNDARQGFHRLVREPRRRLERGGSRWWR